MTEKGLREPRIVSCLGFSGNYLGRNYHENQRGSEDQEAN